MLFHVRMDVSIPPGLDVTDRVAAEKARALELQRAGVWVHLWRIVGRYSNFSVFDVASNDELHGILSALPLYPFMKIEVTPLATHPSDLAVAGGQER